MVLLNQALSHPAAARRSQTRCGHDRLHLGTGGAGMIDRAHDQDEAMKFADRIVPMPAGKGVREECRDIEPTA